MNRARRITDARIRANRLDLLSRLADDLAHEIKNPLHSVAISMELLRRRIEGGEIEAAKERLEVIASESARLHDVVDGLLRLFRPGREADEVLEVDRALDVLVPLLRVQARLARVDLAYSTGGAGARVRIGPAALDQMVLNLTTAALEAIGPGGGRLELATAASADSATLRVGYTAGRPAGNAGPDLAADAARGAAAPGLAVVEELARNAGGGLETDATEEPDRGAAFRLILPRVTGA